MNIGFIGTGWTDRVQIEVYQAAGLQPYGIASGNYENAVRVQKKHNLPKAYAHWKALVDDLAIDTVSITTPTFLHFEMAKYAIEQGKHVICQAPFLNAGETRQLKELSAKYPAQTHVIDFELRFVPVIQHLKQLINSGIAGDILWIELEYRHNFGLNAPPPFGWENDLSKGGGVLNTIADHLIDLSQWLLDDQIREVVADSMTTLKEKNGDQHIQVSCKFANNTLGRILTTSLSAYQGIDVLVHGSKGSFHLKDRKLLSNLGADFPNKVWKEEQVEDTATAVLGEELGNYLFANGSYHFAQSLAGNTANLENAAHPEDAHKMQVVLDQIHASIRERQWKKVSIEPLVFSS